MTPGLGCLTGSTARPTLTRPTQRKHTHGSHAGPKANRSSAKSEGVRRPAAPRRGQPKSQAISASTETPGTNGQRLARSGPALVRPRLALPGWTRCASIRGAPAASGEHPPAPTPRDAVSVTRGPGSTRNVAGLTGRLSEGLSTVTTEDGRGPRATGWQSDACRGDPKKVTGIHTRQCPTRPRRGKKVPPSRRNY